MSNLKAPEINNVVIAGHLIADPTYRYTSKGIAVSNFTIAAKRTFRDKSGTLKESVCFVGVVAWHKLADICAKNLYKGSNVLIEGELQSRNMITEDKKLRIVEVKARQVQFLDENNKKPENNKTPESDNNSNDKNETKDKITEQEVNNTSDDNLMEEEGDNPMKGEFDFGFQDIQI